MIMKQFTILGERCSGTHFLQHAITQNFDIVYDKYQKHFFGHSKHSQQYQTDTLFICIVRNPIEWIDSFFKRTHHVPPCNTKNIHTFLNNEWYSISEEGISKGMEIMDDRNIDAPEKRYTSIFEMRYIKNKYLMEHPLRNKILIRYEDLRDRYTEVLDFIGKQFDLKRLSNNYILIEKYKGTYLDDFKPKPISLSKEIQQYIIDHINLQQEQRLGYLKNTVNNG